MSLSRMPRPRRRSAAPAAPRKPAASACPPTLKLNALLGAQLALIAADPGHDHYFAATSTGPWHNSTRFRMALLALVLTLERTTRDAAIRGAAAIQPSRP